jgi:aspartyl-tRNA(Asn)/glutamyl-tRNA(Gln) amidotransferase subunit C
VKLTEQQVEYVASLANLRLTPEEVARMARDLDGIFVHIDKLNEADTTGVEPMTQVLYEAGETATLRPDEERISLSNEQALANAPLSGSGHYKVPKVIER